jgi:hypothetical protein
VRTALRFVGPAAAGLCVAAVAAMSCAAFLPFVGFPGGDGLLTAGQQPRLTGNLIQGEDARWVMVTLVILGVAAAGNLRAIHGRTTGLACLLASLAALSLVLIDAGSSGRRALPGLYGGPGHVSPPANATLDVGYSVFLIGASMAVTASVIMVVATVGHVGSTGASRRHPGARLGPRVG